MQIIEFFEADDRNHWLSQIKKSDWGAGQLLYGLLKDGKLCELVGEGARVLLLVDGDELISFCTLAPLDDIQPAVLSPWIGFVYTFPSHRGHRYTGLLFDYAEKSAREQGKDAIYISTNHWGLYEKYGFEFFDIMKDIEGEDSRVYVKRL